ncbi:opioid growth factor receptor [Ctenodactylus gundi]
MEDLDCDSTWEEDEDAEDTEDGEDTGSEDTSDADAGDAEDEDAEGPLARPGALQVRPRGTRRAARALQRCDPRDSPCPARARCCWWEEGSCVGDVRAAAQHGSRMTGFRNWRAMQDMRRYRHHYPDLVERDSNGDMPNLSFYKNEIRFLPNGCFIEDILQTWRDNYDLLEDNHSYIQWLFPLREPGVNWHAKPLTLKEVEAFKSSEEVRERLVRAYELMLGFYGIQLENRDTGAVRRAQNYHKRFQNLNWRSHNNLRITRILKSLGELGLEHYQAPLARFFLEETLVRHELPSVRQSALDYFLFAVRCRHQRRELVHFAWEHFQPRCKFVWGPRDKLRKFKSRTTAQPLAGTGQAEGDEGPGEPLYACRPGRHQAGDSVVAEVPHLARGKLQGAGTLEGDQEEEANPLSPKESKKRKLEASRREQASGEPGPQGVSEVEKIALNLEECALSQGSQDPGEAEEPCPLLPTAGEASEARKRRKMEEGAGGEVAGACIQILAPVPEDCPEAQKDGSGENTESQVASEQGAPGSPLDSPGPATTETTVDETGEVVGIGPAKPGKP